MWTRRKLRAVIVTQALICIALASTWLVIHRGVSIGRAMGDAANARNSRNPIPTAVEKLATVLQPGNFVTDHASTTASGAIECGSDIDLVIGVLASPSPRSTTARQTIRETWAQFPTPGKRATLRFLLALDANGRVPEHLLEEAAMKKDLLFLHTLDKYENLSRKVELFFKWVVDACSGAIFVFKTDDDSFVRLDELAKELATQPTERLLYGRMMRHQPAEKNKRGEHDPDNYQKMRSWPDYASGAGYVVTRDVAHLFAYPPIPLRFQKNEDRRVGMVLLGFNVTFVDALRFKPWGHCESDTILMHYHRRRDLTLRRYARAIAGESVCGPGWNDGEMCMRVPQDGNATVHCPGATTVKDVLFASYGQELSDAGHRYPWCEEGLDALQIEPACHAPESASAVRIACKGKSNCDLRPKELFAELLDPCPRQQKWLLTVIKCA